MIAALLAGLLALAPAPVAPADHAAAIHRAEAVGSRMKLLDDAAWGGTDGMLRMFPDPLAAGIKGYIAQPVTGGAELIFYGMRGDEPYPIYVAQMSGRTVVRDGKVDAGSAPALSPTVKRMIAAREAALAWFGNQRELLPCTTGNLNTLVLPPEMEGAPISVYVMTPQVGESLPMGGHFRIDVTADGKIAAARPFMRSCLALPPNGPDGKPVKIFGVSHILDPVPTEIHVFQAFIAGMPLYVSTAQGLWKVSDGKIELTGPVPGQ